MQTAERAADSQRPIESLPPLAGIQTRFRIEAELGRGGMGTVARVLDTATGRRLALKRLLLEPSQAARHERLRHLFEQEYHMLSQLNHPRIIKVFDYGRDALGPYYTMELLEGQDLRELAPMPWKRACGVARDVVSSLAMLHGRGFVHRDVTPQNIRCNQRGQAKLLDFGAMCPMGIAKEVVGTAPFVPPEALRQDSLDGRADLYALGAALYYCLTQRHAYPARNLQQLMDAWRATPHFPRQLNPEVPPALDQLVMELLSLNPAARPQSAAVVFERLVTIADLPRDEGLEVRSAYLASPTLVGRAHVLQRCRDWLLKALRRRGRAVLLSGAPGSGRSRMLDALLLEAKMLGALVLRADASDAVDDYGVLRRLARELYEARPELAPSGIVFEALLGGEPIERARHEVLSAFSGWMVELARVRPLVVAVDDVHAIDEPSLAGIAALASELAETRGLLVTTRDDEAACASQAAMQLLCSHASATSLPALSQEEVRHMLASIFGQARNLDVLAAVLYRRAQGHPFATMRCAQALVDSQVVRYEGGAWVLPPMEVELEVALPRDAELAERVAALSPPALDLVTLLALDVHGHLRFADCVELCAYGSAAAYDALDELVAARILARQADGCSFVRHDYREAVALLLEGTDKLAVHRRLSLWYARAERPAAQAHHAACASDFTTVERLLLEPSEQALVKHWLHDPTSIPTLEAVIAARSAQDDQLPSLLPLRCRLLSLCAIAEEWARVARHGPALNAELVRRCGIADYHRLSHVSQTHRLRQAIGAAERRHADNLLRCGAKPAEGMSLRDALRQLPSVTLIVASASTLVGDAEMARALLSLEPLYPLSPSFPVVERLRKAIVSMAIGHSQAAGPEIRALHGGLLNGEFGLEPAVRTRLLHFTQGFVQGMDAMLGDSRVLERVEQTQRRNPKRAERERYAYYVAIGDTEMAAAARRRLERLEVQSGPLRYFPSAWATEYSLHSLTKNVQGLRHCEDEARRMAEDLPTWQPRVELARLAQAQCSTSSEELLARAERLVRGLTAGTNEHRLAFYICFHALIDLGRYEEAHARVQAEYDALQWPHSWVEGFYLLLAIAEAYMGRHADAKRHVDMHIASYREAGVGGILLGRMHEKAALIALLAGDQPRFSEHARLCADQYRNGYNPALTTRYEVLMRMAREHRIDVSGPLARAAEFSERTSVSALRSVFRTELSTYLDAPSRFRQVLSLVVKRAGARGGLLYLAGAEGLRLVGTAGEHPPALELKAAVEAFWDQETQPANLHTLTLADELPAGEGGSRLTTGPLVVELFLLSNADTQDERACGVLALSAGREEDVKPDYGLVALAQLMLEQDDVVGKALR